MKDSFTVIPHLEDMKEIHKFEKKVLKETNIPVCDISHWNSGAEYKKLIMSEYKPSNFLNISDYHYSYEYPYETKQRVLSQLTTSSDNKSSCVFFHNATATICCIADYLKKHNYKKICVIDPAYFSICSCLLSFGLNVNKETILQNNENDVILPYDNIIQKGYDVVWITSPVFSTGIYFSQKQIDLINCLIQKGIFLIIDESAASPKLTLASHLNSSENIIEIFSPHKYLSMNSIKFAVIVCNQSIATYFEDWIDVFIGSLPASTCMAIDHFLSDNFISCLNIHDQYIENNIKLIQELCTIFPNNYFSGMATNYITIQNRTVSYTNSLKNIDILKIMKQTHVSFIPGYINGFNEAWGFCYRVNLTQDASVIKNSLGRLFSYFS